MQNTLNEKADTGTSTEADNDTSTLVIGPDQLYNAAARERFVQFMQPVLVLQHPNLVRTLAVRARGESVTVVTEAVNAATLESILASDPFLSLPAVQSILDQVAMALDGAHAAGVVHGALSTRSILITSDGDTIVADVGLAPAFEHAGAREAAHDASTFPYASPEAVRNERATEASDQYSLGVVAYELLAGHRPFTGSAAKLKRAHLGKRPEHIGKLQLGHPDAWSEAVMRMLDKSPASRFESLADAMESITPPVGSEGNGFRATLGWLAQQQISGAALPMADEAIGTRLRAARRLFAEPGFVRRHHVAFGFVSLIAIAVGGAAWWGRVPTTALTHISTTAANIEQSLMPESIPSQMTAAGASPALAGARVTLPPVTASASPESLVETAPETPRAAPRAAPRAPTRTTPPPAPRATAHAPVHTPVHTPPQTTSHTPPREVARATPPAVVPTAVPAYVAPAPAPAPAAPATDSVRQTPDRSPAIIATAPASAFPSGAPSSVSATSVPALTTAQADAAARTLVDQLRRGDVRSISTTMVASSADAEFLQWLRGRSGDFQVGTPGAAREVPLPDGSVEVNYTVPIIWTHASGARRTRTVAITASVRPSPSGAKLTTWLLSQAFVP
jgi:serine/threonine-protein kinase